VVREQRHAGGLDEPGDQLDLLQAEVLLEDRGKSIDQLVNAAGHRFVATLDDIARGHYPPRPETRNLCAMCGYVAVCRTVGGLDEDA
jgi:hypothetical protein